MQFMLLVKADRDTEAGVMPSKVLMDEMTRFNESMMQAGVLRAAEGLHPSVKGARVEFLGDARKVIRGPFPDPEQLVAGYWLIETGSLDEAIEWAKRSPNPMGSGARAVIEVRQLFEASDFPEEIFSAENAAREQAMRERLQQPRPPQ